MAKKKLKNCIVCNKEYLSWRSTQLFCNKSCTQKGKNNNSYKHGNTINNKFSITYSVWCSVLKRIKKPHYKTYKNMYLDPRWKDFKIFLEDMGERPSLEYSIDRIDNTKGYYKENCRWATKTEQMNNISSNKIIFYNGQKMTQEQWGKKTGLSGTIICKRLKRGWSVEKALTTPRLK